MSDIALIYLIEPSPGVQQRMGEAARRLGCRLRASHDLSDALEDICALRPDVLVMPAAFKNAGSTDATGSDTAHKHMADDPTAGRRMLDEAGLAETSLLLLLDELPAQSVWPTPGPDDFLRRNADVFEMMARVSCALRLSLLRRQSAALRSALEQQDAQDAAGGCARDTTTHLVEIAAELQSEVCHSVEREEASVREAQTDTIAQAAAALRHEINNPLFAILGSGESALRRLNALRQRVENAPIPPADASPNDIRADIAALIAGVERIQRGGERIEQVVQAISDMLTPATKDYVQGVSMLNLNAHNNSGAAPNV